MAKFTLFGPDGIIEVVEGDNFTDAFTATGRHISDLTNFYFYAEGDVVSDYCFNLETSCWERKGS